MLLETKARLILFTGRMFKMSEYRNFTETELTTFDRYIRMILSWQKCLLYLTSTFLCNSHCTILMLNCHLNSADIRCRKWNFLWLFFMKTQKVSFLRITKNNSLYSFFPHSRDFFQIRICVYPYKFGLAARRGRRDDLCLNCHNWLSQKNSRMEKMKDSKVEYFFSVSVFMYRISCDV